MCKSENFIKLRNAVLSMFDNIDSVGADVHPLIVGDLYEICRILNIDDDLIPTEGRALRLQYGKPDFLVPIGVEIAKLEARLEDLKRQAGK